MLRLSILAGLLVGATVVWWRFGPNDLEGLQAFARSAMRMREKWWAAPSFLVLYAAAGAFGVPITPFTLVAGGIFGAPLGAALSWGGAVLGTAAGYLLARQLGARAVETLAGRRAQKLDELSEKTDFLTLVRLQLIPVIPLSALNLACGVARVRFWQYVGAAAVGVIPGSVIYAYFADQVIAGAAGAHARSRTQIVLASALLIALTFVPTVLARFWGGPYRPRRS